MKTQIENDTRKLFTEAVKELLQQKRIQQKLLAESINTAPSDLSSFLNMHPNKNFSEYRREQISSFFGLTYIDMLLIGKKLCDNSIQEEKEEKYDDKSNKVDKMTSHQCVKNSEYYIDVLENMKWLNNSLREEINNKKLDIEELRKDLDKLKLEIEKKEKENEKLFQENKRLNEKIAFYEVKVMGAGCSKILQ
jgi:transcriptional regulator with XRE-family HTH domain